MRRRNNRLFTIRSETAILPECEMFFGAGDTRGSIKGLEIDEGQCLYQRLTFLTPSF